MIKYVRFATLICDACGDTYREFINDNTTFPDSVSAEEFAGEDGWEIDDGKHFCPECVRSRVSSND